MQIRIVVEQASRRQRRREQPVRACRERAARGPGVGLHRAQAGKHHHALGAGDQLGRRAPRRPHAAASARAAAAAAARASAAAPAPPRDGSAGRRARRSPPAGARAAPAGTRRARPPACARAGAGLW